MFSSPILRAREIADILSQSLHQPYQVTEALRENDCGILEKNPMKKVGDCTVNTMKIGLCGATSWVSPKAVKVLWIFRIASCLSSNLSSIVMKITFCWLDMAVYFTWCCHWSWPMLTTILCDRMGSVTRNVLLLNCAVTGLYACNGAIQCWMVFQCQPVFYRGTILSTSVRSKPHGRHIANLFLGLSARGQ